MVTGKLARKWQVLFNPVNVGGTQDRGLAHGATAFGAFGLQQMAPAGSVEKHFPRGGYFESFRDCFPGFNPFGTSHINLLS
jgi:hypothetical protein